MNTALRQSKNSGEQNVFCPDLPTFVSRVWLPFIRSARHSWRVDERISRQHILPFFGASRFSDITAARVREWLTTLESGRFAVSTRNRIVCVFKDIIKLAAAKNYLDASGLDEVRCAPENRRAATQIESGALDDLLERLAASDRPEARAILLLLLTGAGKTEILAARWENFRPREKRLSVFSQSGKKRVLDLSDAALATLDAIPRVPGSPWIFPGKNKKRPMSQLFSYWKRLREECGLRDVRIRDLSHALDGATPARVSRLSENSSAARNLSSRAPEKKPAPMSAKQTALPVMPIAIIGMAMRFPGGVNDVRGVWDTFIGRKNRITRIPADRWPAEELSHPKRSEPGRSVTFAAGVIEDADKFDAGFFKISPREASWMDPQQRLLLEMALEAMADACVSPEALAGGRCGVYVGVSGMDYGQHALSDLASMSAHTMTGNTLSITANRLSYFYDLRGPSMAIDTACSSGLAAVHQACAALRAGEIPVALAGGVNLLMHPYSFIGFSHASMLSARGQCRPFDASADGYVRGEGGALLLLKPLDRARADGDPIHAVILATGVNSDGARKNGLTIPSSDAQAELMRATLRASGLTSADVDFVEAHGTGTPAGDPAEARSIGMAYGEGRDAPVPIASAKANFGHLEPASGLLGLIKAVLTIKHGVVPPPPFEFTPNPAVDFKGLNVVYADREIPLPKGKPLVGAVNSFGFGGLNAHVLLREYAAPPEKKTSAVTAAPPLFLSANSDASLRALAKIYADRLSGDDAENWYDAAYNAAFNTSLLNKRLAVWAPDRETGVKTLEEIAAGVSSRYATTENAPAEAGATAFIYSGNGSQWSGMGRRLLEESPEFAAIVADLDARMRPVLGYSVLEKIWNVEPAELEDASISQPALFALQAALTLYLEKLGARPDFVAGHSVGEVAAAWASGALTLDEAIRVIHARGRSQSGTRGAGAMGAAGLSAADALATIEELGLTGKLEVAAANSPVNVTVSGDRDALEIFGARVQNRGVFFRDLGLDYAFHSRYMENARPTLDACLTGLKPGAARKAAFVSAVSGEQMAGEDLDAAYWWRNMRETVNFAGAMATLVKAGVRVFVEIGPHAVLQRYARENAQNLGVGARVMPTLQKNADGDARIRATAASVHLLSSLKNVRALFPVKAPRSRMPLYPWDRQRHWFPRTSEADIPKGREHPALGWRLAGVDPAWENVFDPRKDLWLADHRVGDAVVFPAAAYAELALEAASVWLGTEPAALEDFEIFLPMTFEDDAAQTVRCFLNAADGVFRVMSRNRLDDGAWTERARCRVLAFNGGGSATLAASDGEFVTGDDLYAAAARMGLDYGPTFRRISGASRGEGTVAAELVFADAGAWILDPGALDACFHSIVALYAGEGTRDAWLPVGFKRLELIKKAPAARVRAVIRKKFDRLLRADFEILAADDTLIARIDEGRFRLMPAAKQARIPEWVPVSRLASIDADAGWIPGTDFILARAKDALAPTRKERALWFGEILPRLEAATLSALAQNCALAAKNGREPAPGEYGVWMRELLAREGYPDGAGSEDLPDWLEVWREAYAMAPKFLPALLPVARALARLEDLSRLEISPVELAAAVQNGVIASEESWSGPGDAAAATAIGETFRILGEALPSGKELKILALGNLPDKAAEIMISRLDPEKTAVVIVSDRNGVRVHAGALKKAGFRVEIIRANPLEWLEKPGNDKKFDLVVARRVLSEAKNLRSVLAEIRNLLNPGGLLELVEAYPDWSADLVAGLKPGWWRRGENGSPLSSLMAPEAWLEALRESGFTEERRLLEEESGDLKEGAYLICAKKPGENPAPATLSGEWTFVCAGDSSRLASATVEAFGNAGARARLADDFKDEALPERAVIFMDGAKDIKKAPTILNRVNGWLTRFAKFSPAAELYVVTEGGSLAEPCPGYPSSPAQGAATGFFRVAAAEYPDLRMTLIDVAPDYPVEAAARSLVAEAARADFGEEVSISESGRRVTRFLPVPETKRKAASRIKLVAGKPGRLDSLSWAESEPQKDLGPDEIEARVYATGLNFRDVMLSMGLLPEDALENGFAGPTLGLEFAGVVTAVGSNVNSLAPGDRVAGFAPACFSSHVRTPARAAVRVDEETEFESAAAAPTVLTTAWYALMRLASIRSGERVLIHGGAGGVGLMAIQIARNAGAVVYATAGSAEKRDLLKTLGVDKVFDSRDLDFYDQIKAEGGVDVVLNSLAGEAMRRSVALLRPFGRFLELGKRDYVENTSLGLKPFKENVSYFSVDLDQLLMARPELAGEVFAEAMAEMDKGAILPPPYRIFPASEVVEAFGTMQKSRHIGKIVVSLRELPSAETPETEIAPDYAGTWLISGGTSGFGLAIARRLAKMGATTLVLASRRGGDVPDADKIRAEFRELGAETRFVKTDFGDENAVASLVNSINADSGLKGVVHAAAVFDDKLLKDMDERDWEVSLTPKLAGAWNLHLATLRNPPKYFVLFSSISAALGNPGQGNYSAANAGLEALVNLRVAGGAPASAIAWGPIGDAGYLTRSENVGKALAARLGADLLSSDEAGREFDRLAGGSGTRVVARVDWPAVLSGTGKIPGRFEVLARENGGADRCGPTLKERIKTMSEEEAVEALRQCILDEGSRVLGLEVSQISADRSLQSLGMDSLMAMELGLALERRAGFNLPPMLMGDAPTVDQLARRMAQRAFGERERDDELLTSLARAHSETLKPEEIKDVLDAMEAERK